MRRSERIKQLEQLDLEKTAESHQLAEQARSVVLESAGSLIDVARADPGFELPEENTAIRRLAEITGRSGTRPAVKPSPTPASPIEIISDPFPPEISPPTDGGPITKRPAELDNKPRTERVLVVDDDPDIAFALSEVLRDEGYAVRTAEDGLDALKKTLKDKPPPDVLILDIGLPHLGGDGVVAALLTTPFANIPIVIITATPIHMLPYHLRRDYVCVQKSVRMTEEVKAHLLDVLRQRVAEWRSRVT